MKRTTVDLPVDLAQRLRDSVWEGLLYGTEEERNGTIHGSIQRWLTKCIREELERRRYWPIGRPDLPDATLKRRAAEEQRDRHHSEVQGQRDEEEESRILAAAERIIETRRQLALIQERSRPGAAKTALPDELPSDESDEPPPELDDEASEDII